MKSQNVAFSKIILFCNLVTIFWQTIFRVSCLYRQIIKMAIPSFKPNENHKNNGFPHQGWRTNHQSRTKWKEFSDLV
jgi:hypothetical protein